MCNLYHYCSDIKHHKWSLIIQYNYTSWNKVCDCSWLPCEL